MKILLVGDSTVATYNGHWGDMTGWGEALQPMIAIQYPKIAIINLAKPGATTRSFEEEGLYDNLLAQLEPDDIVLIQFGHNDQKPENRVTINDYYTRLQGWLVAIQVRGGQPILCSPVERRNFVDNRQQSTLKEYTQVLRKLARENEVPLFDLNRYSHLLYDSLGEKKSRRLFDHASPGSNYFPVGTVDNTHFSKAGAETIARYVLIRLKEYVSKEPLFQTYYYGACMYPEVWSHEILETDIQRMKQLNMNFARIGEFIWSSLEPEEGVYDFSLVKEALELYEAYEIDVCLCIPTPTPPRWMTFQHPERLIKNSDGTRMAHGSRQHVCTNNEYFRQKAYQLTQKLAASIAPYQHVVVIQLDNEFKCHVDLCYCKSCEKKWHQWLEQEYLEIENLNEAWGTKVWSEEYASFSEVMMPVRTPFLHNSSLMNAFRKFTAESLNEFAHDLTHHIRMETDIPVTHNTAFGFNLLNAELFADLDVAGFDTYPAAENYPAFLLNMDTWRHLKRNNQEMLLLETSTSHAGHIENYIQPLPKGYLVAEAFIGFAGGLKSFSYWHFRNHRYGVEQPHSGVVTAWGEPDCGYNDVEMSGQLLEKMRPLLTKSHFKQSQIAVIYSDHAKRFYTIEHGGIYNYRSLITDWFTALVYAGIQAEMIQETSPLENYQVVMVPFVRHLSTTLLEKLKHFVEQGGQVVFGPMTGDRTVELAWPESNGLDELGTWLNIKQVNQFVANDRTYFLTYHGEPETVAGLVTTFETDTTWQTIARVGGATVMASKKLVKGKVTYLGALPEHLPSSEFWLNYLKKAIAPFEESQSFLTIDKGIVKYLRETGQELQIYLANMTGQMVSFELLQEGADLLNHIQLECGPQELAAYGYLILSFKK